MKPGDNCYYIFSNFTSEISTHFSVFSSSGLQPTSQFMMYTDKYLCFICKVLHYFYSSSEVTSALNGIYCCDISVLPQFAVVVVVIILFLILF